MAPHQDEQEAVVEEAKAVIIEDHQPQQPDSIMAELLPALQSIADTHSVMMDDPSTEAPVVLSTPDDVPLLPLQENQEAQEEQPEDERKYSLQELVSNLMEF